jgi:adenine phosphoribosyltransferase
LSIESRGFIFGGPVANDLLLPLVLTPKPCKPSSETYIKNFNLKYGSTSIEIQKNNKIVKD